MLLYFVGANSHICPLRDLGRIYESARTKDVSPVGADLYIRPLVCGDETGEHTGSPLQKRR